MFHIDKTPRIPEASSNRDNPVHREVHKTGPEKSYDEEVISQTRDEILSKYHIPKNHVITDLESTGENQRIIRAFSIIKHSEDPAKVYYAEGHYSHFELFQKIVDQFNKEIGVDLMADLDLDNSWTIKKGFLDPNNDHFKSFPNARAGLIGIYKENGNINEGVETSEVDNLPNWFLSADSEEKAKSGKLLSDSLD